MTVFEPWRANHRVRVIMRAMVLLGLLFPNQTWGGPSYNDAKWEFDFPRPLKVISKMSNGFRFEIVTPIEPEKILGKDSFGSNSSLYGDQYLIVWPPIYEKEQWPNEPVFMKRLRSWPAEFVENGALSQDYVVIREWSGGASCCFIIYAFQTKPHFKKLIEHNNDFFDASIIPAGEHEIELHETPKSFLDSHSSLKYNPRVFDLRKQKWKADASTGNKGATDEIIHFEEGLSP